jgi:hypothetical protein
MNHFYQDYKKFPENWFTFPTLYSNFVKILNNQETIVEIGSYKGQSTVYMAVEIANSNKKINFYAIDTWEGSKENRDKFSPHFTYNIDKLYDIYLNNISSVNNYINNIKMESIKASLLFEDESIDIVFIDACHEYECVYEDIMAWLPKVKNKGILAGHDYNHGWPGVNKAVDEILGKNNIKTSEFCWIYHK